MRRGVLSCAGMVLAIGLTFLAATSPSFSQSGGVAVKARLWELKLGTPVADLPSPPYMDPHCGTNGGPPSLRLDGWADFAKCPPDRATGLHEVWFTEDDELEYIGLALRVSSTGGGGRAAANWLFNHKMIYSLLIDDAGTVQGYRIFTDPREPPDVRIEAYLPATALATLLGNQNFTCVENPKGEGEQPIDGDYFNETCTGVVDGKFTTIERHLFRKPGQQIFDPATQKATTGYFESNSRIEAIAEGLVKK